MANNLTTLDLRYNEVQQISSHNSYDNNGPKDNIEVQFDDGVRSFELDLHNSIEPRNWDVYHDFPPADFVRSLKAGLAKFKALHDRFPNHEIVTVWLELKNSWADNGHLPSDLDARIDEDLGHLVFRPTDLVSQAHGAESLREVVKHTGWPTLEDLRGKFMFVTMGNDPAGKTYLETVGWNGSCFVAPEEDVIEKLSPGPGNEVWLNSVFFNCHNNDGAEAPQMVWHHGLVSRIWRVDDQDEYDFALSSKAHHIATDHVTHDLFNPRLIDSEGNCFRPFDPGDLLLLSHAETAGR